MSFLQEVYAERWTDAELQRVGRVWEALVKHFFQDLIGSNARVLDIGCGFFHFLNHVQAKEKVGVDGNPLAGRYAAKDVTFYSSRDLSLKMLPDRHFDSVFISNFLEHLENGTQVLDLLKRVGELLRPGGKVIILQPNFRLLGAAYFDFIDHKTILTDRSVEEALSIAGFSIERKIVRFLPYTTKSRVPRHPALVKLYLKLRPLWFFLGKQSLFVGTAPSRSGQAPSDT